MIKEFEKNLIYTFSKNKFIEAPSSPKELKEQALKSGVIDKLDGHEVEVINKLSGKIPVIVSGIEKDVCVLPGWCEAWWKYEEV